MIGESRQGEPKRILLVDDEEALAWSLSSRLAKARPGDLIETAHDGAAALHLLARPTDLLIADIRMPGMSGIDLVLTARAAHPSLPVVVMTAFKSADIERIRAGTFTGYLEKPFHFDRLLELVESALAPDKVGFSGAISVQTLPEIVQLYVLSSATGALQVHHHDELAEIWFDNGVLLHARTSEARGDEAVLEILQWSGGEFSMRVGAATHERTVLSNWQELVMESCRRADERRRDKAQSSRSGWTQTPPPMDDIDLAFGDFDPQLTPCAAQIRGPDNLPNGVATFTLEQDSQERDTSMNIKDSLAKLNQIDGFVGAALVDSESGMLLGQEGGGMINLEVAAAGNTEVVRAKRKTMTNLAMKDGIEDILITLGKQYHLIRPLRARTALFFYVALERQRANLAMARIALADVEKDLQV